MLAINNDVFRQLDEWYQGPLGKVLAVAVKRQLEESIQNIFGYHALQLGIPSQRHWLEATPIPHKACVTTQACLFEENIVSDYESLPFPEASIDLVFLPHTLGFVINPQALLKEVDRILVHQGHMVILGFNPISLWGMARLFARYRGSAPWVGNFTSIYQLHKLLNTFSYETISTETFFYRPPMTSSLDKLLFLETMGNLSWLYPGAVYLLVIQKQLHTATPIRPIWRFRNFVWGKELG